MKQSARQAGFTLIEVLLVVSILALLLAILIPAISRAREQVRLVLCQKQMGGLVTAFSLYATANHGQCPGNLFDPEADWLGANNLTPPHRGRMPEDGTLFRNYMGSVRRAYVCPMDTLQPLGARFFSYSATLALSGAKMEAPSGAHYRSEPDPLDSRNFSETDHRAHMKSLGGAPLILEEDEQRSYVTNIDGGWGNTDSVTDRHLFVNGRGWGNIGFIDGHVDRVQLSPSKSRNSPGLYFHAGSICIHYGRQWIPGSHGSYGYLDNVSSAELMAVRHE